MAEVDRLSNSGLYPALPIADKRSRKESPGQQPPDQQPPRAAPKNEPAAESKEPPRPPKSLIDDYA